MLLEFRQCGSFEIIWTVRSYTRVLVSKRFSKNLSGILVSSTTSWLEKELTEFYLCNHACLAYVNIQPIWSIIHRYHCSGFYHSRTWRKLGRVQNSWTSVRRYGTIFQILSNPRLVAMGTHCLSFQGMTDLCDRRTKLVCFSMAGQPTEFPDSVHPANPSFSSTRTCTISRVQIPDPTRPVSTILRDWHMALSFKGTHVHFEFHFPVLSWSVNDIFMSFLIFR